MAFLLSIKIQLFIIYFGLFVSAFGSCLALAKPAYAQEKTSGGHASSAHDCHVVFSFGGETLVTHDFVAGFSRWSLADQKWALSDFAAENTSPMVDASLRYEPFPSYSIGFDAAFSFIDMARWHLSFLFSQELDVVQAGDFSMSLGFGVGYAYRRFHYIYDEPRSRYFIIHSCQLKESLSLRYRFNDLFSLGISSGVSEYIGKGKVSSKANRWNDDDWYGDIMVGVDYKVMFVFHI